MSVPSARRWAASTCLLALMASFGCTPGQDPDPTPSPVTTVATPPETAQEREERLAYEAAEASYRTFRAEFERVLSRGGAKQPTALMSKTAGGSYLKSYQEVSAAYKNLHHHSVGKLTIVYVRPQGYEKNELLLVTCEDGTGISTLDASGKRLFADDIRKLSLVVRLEGGVWKVWSGSGEKVSTCE